MKKNYLLLTWAFISLFVLAACSDDDDNYPSPVGVRIESATGKFRSVQNEALLLTAQVDNPSETTFCWRVDGKEVSQEQSYEFTGSELKDYAVEVAVAHKGNQGLAGVQVEVHGKYKYGTFVLGEGFYGHGGGFLSFIDEEGRLTDHVFRLENDTQLAGTSQDLYIRNGKLYIISYLQAQLVVANAGTLRAEAIYDSSNGLQDLRNPSHVAVPKDDYVYLRDANGLHLFRPSTQSCLPIEGTSSPATQPMAVANNHVFAVADKQIVAIEAGSDTPAHTLALDADALSVIPAKDGNLWAIDTQATLYQINASDFKVTAKHTMGSDVQGLFRSTWNNGAYLSAKGDTLILSGSSTQVYRHIFGKNQTEKLFDAKDYVEGATDAYQSAYIHPQTGHIYLTTHGGWSDYRVNVFDVSNPEHIRCTSYRKADEAGAPERFPCPAGYFFTENFQ